MLFNMGKVVKEERKRIFSYNRKDENLLDKKSDWENNIFKEGYEQNEARRNRKYRRAKKQESQPQRKVVTEFQDRNLFEDAFPKKATVLDGLLRNHVRKNMKKVHREQSIREGEKYTPVYREFRQGLTEYRQDRQKPKIFSEKIIGIFKNK